MMRFFNRCLIAIFIFGILCISNSLVAQEPTLEQEEHLSLLLDQLTETTDASIQLSLYSQLIEYFKYKDTEKSREYLLKGLALAEQEGSVSDRLFFLERKGMLENMTGEYFTALRTYHDVIKDPESSQDSILSKIHYGIGIAYFSLLELQRALHHFELSVHYCNEFGQETLRFINVGMIGSVYRSQGKPQKALLKKKEAFVMIEQADMPNMLAYVSKDIAELYSDLGRSDSAVYFVKQSIQLGRQYVFPMIEIEGHIALGKILHKKGDFIGAIAAADSAKLLARRVSTPQFHAQADVLLSQIYYDLGQDNQSMIHAYEALKVSDGLLKAPAINQAYLLLEKLYRKRNDYEQAYDFLQKSRELEQKQKEQTLALEMEMSDFLEEELQSPFPLPKNQIIVSDDKASFWKLAILGLLVLLVLGTMVVESIRKAHIGAMKEALFTQESLKVHVVKRLTIVGILLCLLLALYSGWMGFGKLMGLMCIPLFVLGGIYPFISRKRIRFVFWWLVLLLYPTLSLILLVAMPLISLLIVYLAIYIVANHLSSLQREKFANLSLLIIGLGIYSYVFLENAPIDIRFYYELELAFGLASAGMIILVWQSLNNNAYKIKSELLLREQFLEEISGGQPFFLILKNTAGNLVYVNDHARKRFGIIGDTYQGQKLENFISDPKIAQQAKEINEKILLTGGNRLFSANS